MDKFLACPFVKAFTPDIWIKGFLGFVAFVALFYLINKLIDLKQARTK